MRRRIGWALIVASVTGCAAGHSSDPFVVIGPPASVPRVVARPVGPVVASTPTLAPAVASSAEGPAIGSPTTSTVEPATLARAELLAGFDETYQAAAACLAQPGGCDPATVALAGGPAYERFARLAATYGDAGYVVRRLADLSHWSAEAVDVDSGEATGFLTICDVDGDLVVEPGESNGFGQDIVINDLVVARRVRIELRRTDAGWRRWEIVQLGEWPMESTCAPA